MGRGGHAEKDNKSRKLRPLMAKSMSVAKEEFGVLFKYGGGGVGGKNKHQKRVICKYRNHEITRTQNSKRIQQGKGTDI